MALTRYSGNPGQSENFRPPVSPLTGFPPLTPCRGMAEIGFGERVRRQARIRRSGIPATGQSVPPGLVLVGGLTRSTPNGSRQGRRKRTFTGFDDVVNSRPQLRLICKHRVPQPVDLPPVLKRDRLILTQPQFQQAAGTPPGHRAAVSVQ